MRKVHVIAVEVEANSGEDPDVVMGWVLERLNYQVRFTLRLAKHERSYVITEPAPMDSALRHAQADF